MPYRYGTESISPDRLTEAQRVALRMFMARMTAKEIGLRLGITPKAVELRLKGAREALGVSSSAEAARILAAHEAPEAPAAFRNTLGGPSEVVQTGAIASSGLRESPDEPVEPPVPFAPDRRPGGGADRGMAWVREIDWPLRSERRRENDLTLAQRLLWPLLIMVGTLIGLGILINSLATLSQVAVNLFGVHR